MNLNGCETWCGLRYEDPAVPCDWDGPGTYPWGAERGRSYDKSYCTAECRDRAAGKAAPTVERLAAGWVRQRDTSNYPCGCGQRSEFGTADGRFGRACVACAPTAGVFADSPVPDAKPTPQPAKVAPPFRCNNYDGSCKTTTAPASSPTSALCVVCNDVRIGALMAAKGLQPDGPPPPKRPRVRAMYRSDNWRDSEYAPNAEME